jgi:3-phosphoshikimate 1-carboxyvinyltransferase
MTINFTKKSNQPLQGEIFVASDKSISHRAVIFASLAYGISKIYNILEGEDVLKTISAFRSMGVEITKKTDHWQVVGVGLFGLNEPNFVLDMGNSGTSTRLLAGLVATRNFTTFFNGDASLHKRPMQRIFTPMQQFGAKILARQNNLLPFAVVGNDNAMPIQYEMPVASAQIKSCILLSALTTKGITTIIEPELCRDHTEIMMQHLGLKLDITANNNNKNAKTISYQGLQEFNACNFFVPSDISSAAFFIVAALIVEGSNITLKNVGINPLRTGIITSLQEMGGDIIILNTKTINGELVADIKVCYSKLKAINVPASRSAFMIDEYPIFAVACAFAFGTTTMNGLAELKVKESNRLMMIANNLQSCGVKVVVGSDSLEITGGVNQAKEIIKLSTALDHRIAMSALIMGLNLNCGIEIDDSTIINTSFPQFFDILQNMKQY